MANIDQFVTVTVTKTSASVTQQGFGTPLGLFQVSTSIIPTRYASFSSPSELLDAGALVTDPVYLWAQRLQGQSVSPVQFAVGRRTASAPQVDTVLISSADEGLWTLTIDTIVYSYTATLSDTEITIAQGLMDAILAADAVVGSGGSAISVPGGTLVAGTFTVTAWVAGEGFVNGGIVDGDAGTGTFISTDANPTAENITTALEAVKAENNDWYGLNIESRQDADILLANTWVSTELKVLVVTSSDSDVLTTAGTDIGTDLGATNNKRTQLMWHHDPKDFADGAMLGRALAATLDQAATPTSGQITWAAKQLQGIQASNLNTNQLDNLKANSSDVFITVQGLDVTLNGKSVQGEFMDIQTTLDWTQSRVGEAVFGSIANAGTKLPFDDSGIAVTKADVRGVLDRGGANGHFSEDDPAFPSVSVPKSVDVSTADKNSRTLRDVVGRAKLQGAIHAVFVQVNVEA